MNVSKRSDKQRMLAGESISEKGAALERRASSNYYSEIASRCVNVEQGRATGRVSKSHNAQDHTKANTYKLHILHPVTLQLKQMKV